MVNFRLKSISLGVTKLIGSHTAEYISEVIGQVLKFYNITNKVIAMTADNASTMIKAARLLYIPIVPCFAHILDLIVKKSFKSLGMTYSVEIEDSAQTETDDDVESVENLIKKCRRLVGLFNHSTSLNDDLREDQIKNHKTEKPLRLIQDVATR